MFVLYLFVPDKSQAVRSYKQHMQSARDYNFGCPTENYFRVDSFQPIR